MTLAPVVIAALLALGACSDCDRDGYVPLRVLLVSGAPASARVTDPLDPGCVVYTDLPTDVANPDAYPDQLRHVGESVYRCLAGTSETAVSRPLPPGAFYEERLWFRMDGSCPGGFYGCFNLDCRTVDVDLLGGKHAACQAGVLMGDWDDACWRHFYAVLGHEVMHGWLGAFHP